MPQDPIVPGPPGENNPPPKPGVDPKSFLLPKKEVHAPENAERINAGALLESEQNATLPKPERPTPPPAQSKIEESEVRAIDTYQRDVERVVQTKNTSIVSIAAAEAQRRGMESIEAKPDFGGGVMPRIRKIVMIVGGVILLLAALGLLLFALRPADSVDVNSPEQAPFINVDETKILTVPSGAIDHLAMIQALEQQREEVSISLGLISRFYVAEAATTSGAKPRGITTQKIMTALSPTIPGPLLRALDEDEHLLGVHSYDSNQPFLILKTDSYEQVFSNMLVWEQTIRKDLSPLFTRKPQEILVGTVATSSPTSTPTIVLTGFVDRIVENQNARVVQDESRSILLLWTFLDRNTLVITTNEATLREIISRLRNAPVVPQL